MEERQSGRHHIWSGWVDSELLKGWLVERFIENAVSEHPTYLWIAIVHTFNQK